MLLQDVAVHQCPAVGQSTVSLPTSLSNVEFLLHPLPTGHCNTAQFIRGFPRFQKNANCWPQKDTLFAVLGKTDSESQFAK
jgi:hypothetical protein